MSEDVDPSISEQSEDPAAPAPARTWDRVQRHMTHVGQGFSPAESSPEGLPHLSATGLRERVRVRDPVAEQGEGVLTRGRVADASEWVIPRDSSPLAEAEGLGGVPEHVDRGPPA
jgi:hypothetical protein